MAPFGWFGMIAFSCSAGDRAEFRDANGFADILENSLMPTRIVSLPMPTIFDVIRTPSSRSTYATVLHQGGWAD
jgi:hypothetical protein